GGFFTFDILPCCVKNMFRNFKLMILPEGQNIFLYHVTEIGSVEIISSS
ncbi:MAG: hypothetical protein BROFUL_02704, partial [Candidatus Brocadia fulgida]